MDHEKRTKGFEGRGRMSLRDKKKGGCNFGFDVDQWYLTLLLLQVLLLIPFAGSYSSTKKNTLDVGHHPKHIDDRNSLAADVTGNRTTNILKVLKTHLKDLVWLPPFLRRRLTFRWCTKYCDPECVNFCSAAAKYSELNPLFTVCTEKVDVL